MVEDTSRSSIDVGIRVLGLREEMLRKSLNDARKNKTYLAMFLQDVGRNLEGLRTCQRNVRLRIETNPYLVHQINDRTALQLRTSLAELLEGNETRIRVSEYTMSVAGGEAK